MQERLRIISAVTGEQGGGALRDYELQLYEGEICYVQGIPGSGVRALVRLLAGECALLQGAVLVGGRELTEGDRRRLAWEQGVYLITSRDNLVEEMTVGDNLEAIRPVLHVLGKYDPRRAGEHVAAYLQSQQVDIPADAFVWSLGASERSQLSILKGRLHGAQVIVLDASGELYEGKEAHELCQLILRLRGEGVTFLLLSEHYSEFATIADRIQWIEDGRDRKEWPGLNADSERVLKGQRLMERPERFGRGERAAQGENGGFLGLYDFEWEMTGGIRAYLAAVREAEPVLWDRHLHLTLPEEGSWRSSDAVLIPADSADLLLENESIADNLILPLAGRVARRRFGYISPGVKRGMRNTFFRRFQIDEKLRRVEQLDRVQRKLLSVYRYELDRPKAIVLESPYAGLDPEQARTLRDYLRTLPGKGIRVLCFSKSMESLREDCGAVLVTENGRRGKIVTF